MKPLLSLALICAAAGALCAPAWATSNALPRAADNAAATAPAASDKTPQKPHLTYWSGLAVSPHGKRLAFVTYTKQGPRLQIADAEAGHARSVQMPAADKDCRPGRAQWSPDGSRLAFLSSCGNANPAQRDIWLVNTRADTLQAKRLTHLDGYVHGLAWAPKGQALGILYVAGDTHPVAATAASKPRVGVIGVSNVEHQQVARIDAKSGSVQLITPAALFVYEFSFAPNAQRLAYIAAPPPGANNWWKARLYTQAVAGDKPHELVNAWAAKGSLHHLQMASPRFSPDGQTIAFIGGLMSDQGVTGGDIYLVPSHGGRAVNVTPGIHVSPAWLTFTDNQHLLVAAYAGAGSEIGLFTLNGTAAASHRTLFTTPSAVRGLSVADDASRFAFVHSTFNQAPEIYAGSLAVGTDSATGSAAAVHAITHANEAVKPDWGKGVEVRWHNEGYTISGWLLLPKDYDPSQSYPMIVNVHGGPVWAFRAHWPRGTLAEYSRRGYFVFMPNPRGSLGQGAAFTQAVRRDMGYGDLRDILAGIDTVEKNYAVDDNRLGLTGWSYGGFMSMFAPTQTQRFKAAVAGAGLANWQSYYGQNMIDQWMLPFFGASVYDDPAVYAKSSAINFIKQDKTPTLILAGQFDKECPAAQSFEMWHGLRAMGTPTELVVYAGEGHHFHDPAHQRDAVKRTMAWFGHYLQPGKANAKAQP